VTAYRAEIAAAAATHRLDPNLVEAVILIESSGQADAFRFEPGFYDRYLKDKPEYAGKIPRRISSSYGLMQVMYTTALACGFDPTAPPEHLFVPAINLEYGCRKLSLELAWATDVAKALAAYNAGRGNWDSASGRLYAQRVLARLDDVRKKGVSA
jgi:soluble lytic murein transglycosylase-like protein